MVQKTESGSGPEGVRDPFAPPAEGTPERPWQPRHPHHGYAKEDGHGEGPEDGTGNTDGTGDAGETGDAGATGDQGSGGAPEGAGGPAHRPVVPPPHPWSPGYQGQQRPQFRSQPPLQRFDPTDPVQRRARHALTSGMFGLLFFFSAWQITLLLASLSLYWSISAIRGKAKPPVAPAAAAQAAQPPAAPPATSPYGGQYAPAYRPQLPAAVVGLICAVAGLALVAATFGFQVFYKDYYNCVNDAPTHQAAAACRTLRRASPAPAPPGAPSGREQRPGQAEGERPRGGGRSGRPRVGADVGQGLAAERAPGREGEGGPDESGDEGSREGGERPGAEAEAGQLRCRRCRR
jgi:hypothetical protein